MSGLGVLLQHKPIAAPETSSRWKTLGKGEGLLTPSHPSLSAASPPSHLHKLPTIRCHTAIFTALGNAPAFDPSLPSQRQRSEQLEVVD